MILTEEERAEALAVLERAGILGSDARTSLEQIERLSGDLSLAELRADFGRHSPPVLQGVYGADAMRAVLALRAPAVPDLGAAVLEAREDYLRRWFAAGEPPEPEAAFRAGWDAAMVAAYPLRIVLGTGQDGEALARALEDAAARPLLTFPAPAVSGERRAEILAEHRGTDWSASLEAGARAEAFRRAARQGPRP